MKSRQGNLAWLYSHNLQEYLEVSLWEEVFPQYVEEQFQKAEESDTQYPHYPLVDLKRKVNQLEAEVRRLKQENGSEQVIAKMQVAFRKHLDSLEEQNKQLAERISSLEEKAQERTISDALEQKISALQQENAQLKLTNQKLESRLEKVEQTIANIDHKPPVPPKDTQTFTSTTSSAQQISLIDSFVLPPCREVLFGDKEWEIEEGFKLVLKLEPVKQAIAKANLPSGNQQAYLNIIADYEKQIKKIQDKFNYDAYDEEAVSEEVTGQVKKVLENKIIKNLLLSLYRALKAGQGSSVLPVIRAVNLYLQGMRVYNRKIAVNTHVSEQDISEMVPFRKPTTDKQRDYLIDEVELLPYYLNYLDDEGDVAKWVIEGKMVVWSYQKEV